MYPIFRTKSQNKNKGTIVQNDLIGNIFIDPQVAQSATSPDQMLLGGHRKGGSITPDIAFSQLIQTVRTEGPEAVLVQQNQDISPELTYKITYQVHLGESLENLASDVQSLSLEEQQELQNIVELLGKKLLHAHEDGQIELSASTQRQLENIVSGDASFEQVISFLTDPIAVADVQAALYNSVHFGSMNREHLDQIIQVSLNPLVQSLVSNSDQITKLKTELQRSRKVELPNNSQIFKDNSGKNTKAKSLLSVLKSDGLSLSNPSFGINNAELGLLKNEGGFQSLQQQTLAAQSTGYQTVSLQASSAHVTAQQASQGQSSVLNQVLVQVNKNAGNNNKFRIQLNPSSLGHVDVRMKIDQDGRTRAVIVAERPETLNVLQKDADQLIKAFQNAGLQTNLNDLSFGLQYDADNLFKQAMKNGANGGQQNKKQDIDEAYASSDRYKSIFLDNKVNYIA